MLKDTVAIVGTTENRVLLVSLSDPRSSLNAGVMSGGKFGDRLALSGDGVLISSSYDTSRGGLQVVALSTVAQIMRITPPHLSLDQLGRNTESIEVEYQFLGSTEGLSKGTLDFMEDGGVVATFRLSDLSLGRHTITIPAESLKFNPSPRTVEISVLKPEGSTTTPYVTTIAPQDSDDPLQYYNHPNAIAEYSGSSSALADSPDKCEYLFANVNGWLLGGQLQVDESK